MIQFNKHNCFTMAAHFSMYTKTANATSETTHAFVYVFDANAFALQSFRRATLLALFTVRRLIALEVLP